MVSCCNQQAMYRTLLRKQVAPAALKSVAVQNQVSVPMIEVNNGVKCLYF